MNQKRAKALRRVMRQQGINPAERSYVAQSFHQRVLGYFPELGADGKPRAITVDITNPIRLLPCGRLRYQHAKKAMTA